MHWTEYAAAMLLFSLVSLLLLYLIQRLQGYLPFNPQNLPGVDSSASATGGFVGSAFNTAASFTSNTNWQSYVPEVTMSYLTQMAGLAYHNFGSAATGIVSGDRFHSWHCPPRNANHRKFLGRLCPLQSLCALAGLRVRRFVAGVAGSSPELSTLRHREVARTADNRS